MTENNETKMIPNSLKLAHEYAFSLNLAWATVWIGRVKMPVFGGPFGSWLSAHATATAGAEQLVAPIGGHTIMDQLTWSFVIAALIFILLRVLWRTELAKFLLRGFSGIVVALAFPIAALFFGASFPNSRVNTSWIWLALEVLIVLAFCILYYVHKPRISTRLPVIVFLVHFSLWTWAASNFTGVVGLVNTLRSSEYYHPWMRTLGSLGFALAFNFGFPVIGLLSSLTWLGYLKRQSEIIGHN